jgi:hypothetical protein
MGVFVSANWQVAAQYDRLQSALGTRLPPEHKMDEAVHSYVWDELSKLAPGVPLGPDGSEITEEVARLLCERFRSVVSLDVRENKSILTAGGVSFYFSCLVYYILGRSIGAPTPLQIQALLNVCDIADTRPLPVKRWTEFVRSNVKDVARIRTVMRSCIYSKTLQSTRLTRVVASLTRHLFEGNIRVLAIGSSGTVMDALKGLKKESKLEVFLTRPTPGVKRDTHDLGFDFVYIDEKDLPTDANEMHFDLIVMGCGVIGKTPDNEIEIVNWARDIDIATRIRKLGALLVIVGGLYKIWPQSFYRSHKEIAINKKKETLAGFEAILLQRDMDWLVTEHEAVSFRGDRPSWVEFLFGAHSLDVTASLSLFANEKSENEGAFIQSILQNENIRDIDKNLGLLSSQDSGREADESPRQAAAPTVTGVGFHDTNPRGWEAMQYRDSVEGDQYTDSTQPFLLDYFTMAFKAFKLGFLLMIVGLACWALFLASNKMTLALGASAIAAIGANILMLAVLGDRRGA